MHNGRAREAWNRQRAENKTIDRKPMSDMRKDKVKMMNYLLQEPHLKHVFNDVHQIKRKMMDAMIEI